MLSRDGLPQTLHTCFRCLGSAEAAVSSFPPARLVSSGLSFEIVEKFIFVSEKKSGYLSPVSFGSY